MQNAFVWGMTSMATLHLVNLKHDADTNGNMLRAAH